MVDDATGLMWQQSGSPNYMKYAAAEQYVQKLNNQRFAGYSDWRLPTLEEAMSLMETSQKNGELYIDPVFDKMVYWIWTTDKKSAGVVWFVDFDFGYCDDYYVDNEVHCYVRAVRSGQ